MWSVYLFFVHSYVYSKIETRGKNGTEISDGIKEELLKSLIDGDIEFKLGWRRKLWGNNRVCLKGALNMAYIKRLSFDKSKEPDKFRASKTR